MLNVLSFFFGQKWAILPDYYQKAERVLLDWKDGNNIPQGFNNKAINQPYLGFIASDKVYMAESPSGFGSSQVKGVAVIPVFGAMVKRAGMMDDVSGLQSSEAIISYIKQAEQDPNISAILLHFDSPGGTVDGTEELARVIRNSSKPVDSFVDGMAASAALWAASQSRRITLKGETSAVGSIGVVVEHVDESAALENAGLKVTYITSKKAVNKIKGASSIPLTDESAMAISEELNTLANIFEKDVRAGRAGKLSARNDDKIFDGSMFYGSEAVKLGLADEIGTLEDAIRKAARGGKKSTQSQSATNQHNNTEMKNLFAFLKGNDKIAATAQADTGNEQVVVTSEQLAAIDKDLGEKAAALEAKNNALTIAAAELAKSQAEAIALKEESDRLKAENARLAGKGTDTGAPAGDPAGSTQKDPNAGKPSGFGFFANLQKYVEKH